MANSQWQPKEDAIQKEYSNIEFLYKPYRGKIPAGFEPAVREFAKIAVFLQDKNAILVQLKKLNALLIEEAKKRNLVINEQEPNSYLKHKKLLRNVLELELKKIGFVPNLGKAIGLLPPCVFRSAIREGLIVKDPGAGIKHGEFTHAIQWLLIGYQQNDTKFLDKPVIEIFKQLGDDRSSFRPILSGEDHGEFNIWDTLVDRVVMSQNCRSPDYLHEMILTSDDPDLLLLKTLCDSRVKKRKKMQPANLSPFSDQFFQDKTYPNKDYEVSEKNKNLLLPRKK